MTFPRVGPGMIRSILHLFWCTELGSLVWIVSGDDFLVIYSAFFVHRLSIHLDLQSHCLGSSVALQFCLLVGMTWVSWLFCWELSYNADLKIDFQMILRDFFSSWNITITMSTLSNPMFHHKLTGMATSGVIRIFRRPQVHPAIPCREDKMDTPLLRRALIPAPKTTREQMHQSWLPWC